MILKANPIRIIRFDVNKGATSSAKTKIRWEDGTVSPTGEKYLLIRWYVTATENGIEIIGYLCEKRAIYENTTIEKDTEDMVEFLLNIYLNVQMHFQDNPKIGAFNFKNMSEMISDSSRQIIKDLYN